MPRWLYLKSFDCEILMASLSFPSFRCFATFGANSTDCRRACVNVNTRSQKTPTDHIDIRPSTAMSNLTSKLICSQSSRKSI